MPTFDIDVSHPLVLACMDEHRAAGIERRNPHEILLKTSEAREALEKMGFPESEIEQNLGYGFTIAGVCISVIPDSAGVIVDQEEARAAADRAELVTSFYSPVE